MGIRETLLRKNRITLPNLECQGKSFRYKEALKGHTKIKPLKFKSCFPGTDRNNLIPPRRRSLVRRSNDRFDLRRRAIWNLLLIWKTVAGDIQRD